MNKKYLLVLSLALSMMLVGCEKNVTVEEPEEKEEVVEETYNIDEIIKEYKPNELGDIPVIMYHAILEKAPSAYQRTIEGFKKDLKYMYEHDFVTLSMQDYVNFNIDIPAWILALVIGVILYFTFMKSDDTNLTGFKKKLYGFLTFKSFIIKKVLTFVYVIVALYFTIFGALYLFVSPLYGLLYLVIYNLLARLGFEFIIAVIDIKENTDLDEDLDDVIIIDEDDIEFVDEEIEDTEEDEEIEKKPATKAKKTKKEE